MYPLVHVSDKMFKMKMGKSGGQQIKEVGPPSYDVLAKTIQTLQPLYVERFILQTWKLKDAHAQVL